MEVWILRGISRLFRFMPLKRALAIGRGMGWIFGSVLRYHRKDALDALQRSLPGRTDADYQDIIKRMYANLGMNMVESLRFAAGDMVQAEEMVEEENEHIVREALERGKGALMLTAHYGNWDLLSIMTPLKGFALTIISKDMKNKALNDFWMGMRQDRGLHIVPAHNSYRKCRAALKKNEMIGFILDQNMIDKEGVFVDFFGRPACTTPGLAFMAAQSQAPIVPVFIHRIDGNGRHKATVYPIIEPPPNRDADTIKKATQDYTKIIEDEICKHPEQWIWIHRRWRTEAPPDYMPPYS